MKRYRYLNGLLVSFVLIFASCSPLTLNVKDRSLATEQNKNTQAILTTVQTAPGKTPRLPARLLKKYKDKISAILSLLWLWLLARFYGNEKRRRVRGWQLEDLALLKIIKDNAARLWNHHPGKNIISHRQYESGVSDR